MRTSAALALALATIAACGEHGHAPAASPLGKLPGTIWFVEDGPPHKLVRLTAGVRREWVDAEAGLYPMSRALPDGRLVAISSRGDGSAQAEQLALVPPDGGVQRIGPAAPQVRDPAIDPGGRWIIVAANPDGHSDLYRIDLATGTTVRLTDDPQGNFAPARLGDGAIVFVSSRDGDAEIYRMAIAGGAPQRLTAFHRDDWQPAVSPDGAAIAFTSDRERRPRIFLMASDGTAQRRLTSRGADGDAEETDPVWSPDGRSIAYVLRRTGEALVRVRDLATGAERVISPTGARDAEPSWAPDGAWIIVSRGGDHDRALWAIPIAGGDPVRVAPDRGAARLPRWL